MVVAWTSPAFCAEPGRDRELEVFEILLLQRNRWCRHTRAELGQHRPQVDDRPAACDSAPPTPSPAPPPTRPAPDAAAHRGSSSAIPCSCPCRPASPARSPRPTRPARSHSPAPPDPPPTPCSPWKIAGANVTRSTSSSIRYGVPSSEASSSATDAAAAAVREPALGFPTTVTTDCGQTGGSGTIRGSKATDGHRDTAPRGSAVRSRA